MGDLTIVNMEQCISLDERYWKVKDYTIELHRGEYSCTCPSFQYRRKECKHIAEVKASLCGWHEQYSDKAQVTPKVCPRCGKETMTVRVGV